MDYAMRGRITALILNTGGSMEVVAGVLSICSESERDAGILRSALAESERLRVEAEAKVAAWTKCVAQSSTQYREMVAELDDYKAYYDYYADEPVSASYGDMLKAKERIEARRERSTP